MEYNKLKGRIVEKGYSARTLAKEIGVSEGAFYMKLHGEKELKRSEIEAICKALDIKQDEIPSYFFSNLC